MRNLRRTVLFTLNFFLLNPLGGANPWAGHNTNQELADAIERDFPLKGATIELHGELVSVQGWRGTLAESSESIGGEFFCDFQLREDLGKKTSIRTNHPIRISDVKPFFGSDQEVSRVGVFLILEPQTITGSINPIELVACIRTQQRDQLPNGWMLTTETSFSLSELKTLLKPHASLSPD